MFDFLKKEEFNKIAQLEEYIKKADESIAKWMNIAKERKVVACRNKKCSDWENGTCSLNEIVISPSEDGIAKCEDFGFDDTTMYKEFVKEAKSDVANFVKGN